MNLEEHWISKGATTYRAREGYPSGDGGEGNSVGLRWWFLTSNHDVKIMIFAKFNHGQRLILLDKWEEEERAAREGAATTRWSAVIEPVLQQAITITNDNTGDPRNTASYTVNGGVLVLEFRLLFLRDPSLGEGDLS
jgi:hypothetical protein